MTIITIPPESGLKHYKKIVREIYGKDPFFKDNKTGLYPLVCDPKSPFYIKSSQKIIGILSDQVLKCMCVCICHEAAPHQLTVAFFEAVENAALEVKWMLEEAEKYGKSLGCQRMVMGLQGHCNYGIGFAKTNQGFPSFGEAYNPPYYLEYFKEYTPVSYFSFHDQVSLVAARVYELLPKFQSEQEKYTLQHADFSRNNLKSTIERYTQLNNAIFIDHPYYFKRTSLEDLALFQSMLPLLHNDNLIFIQKEGVDIGFILWYMDYNTLVSQGAGAGIGTFLKYKALNHKINTVEIVEIGVQKAFQKTPAILYLFNAVLEIGLKKNPNLHQLISSWIYEKNKPSLMITQKFAKIPHKEYVTYEREI